MSAYHARDIEEVVRDLETNKEAGLSQDQYRERLEKYGPNLLEEKSTKPWYKIAAEQFINPIVWILIVAGVLAFIFEENLEGIAIGIVILINAIIGFWMEFQAVKSMDQLQKLGRGRTKVIRDGERREVDSANIVPGDLVFFEAGDMISADARIVQQSSLAIKESALTGESAQVDKTTTTLEEETQLGDRQNCVFRGTAVTRGNGYGIVYATGENTQIGEISGLTHGAEKEATPLDKRLQDLSKKLIWLTLIISALMIIIGVSQGRDWLIMVETAIALAVAAIPEGLPVIATMTLARGMLKLARKNVIVKSLQAVQTLGETNTILTDKTGTLTENEMYVDLIRSVDDELKLSDKEVDLTAEHKRMLLIGVLCNDSEFISEDESSGDPIEVALLRAGDKYLTSHKDIQEDHERVKEIPFDSEIQMMGTVNRNEDAFLISVKGSIEAVLSNCSRILKNGKPSEIDNYEKKKWEEMVSSYSAEGLRVLAIAYRESNTEPEDEFIHDLVFSGVIGFIDPAREDVRESIERCQNAGIRVIMVTGDHPETAGNIGQKVGIVRSGSDAVKVTGKEMSDSKRQVDTEKTEIFARISPAQKLDLVKVFQDNNRVVGMTGDGVNDAPALKKADIGIAMGTRGTEAAMDAADIILRDDAFSSIVVAVEQGRIIFENIRNFVIYLLSCNLSEIMVVSVASFVGMPLPLLPLQILYLNMVTDVFPALAMGFNKGEKNIMDAPPRNPDEALVPRSRWAAIVVYGIAMTIAIIGIELMGIYVWELSDSAINNLTFYTLIMVQLINVFNIPERSVSFFNNQVTRNPYVWGALVLCVLLVAISYWIPEVREALNMIDLKWENVGWILIFSLIPTMIIQLLKRVFKVIV